MPETIIYKHANTDCPHCVKAKGKSVSSEEGDKLVWRCRSMAVYGANKHNACWVLRCEEVYKKCPGYRIHKKVLSAFKSALAKSSRRISVGRIVAKPDLENSLSLPKVDLNSMDRQEPGNSLRPERVAEGGLEYYGFTKVPKTQKNKKKRMWRVTEDWYVRRS